MSKNQWVLVLVALIVILGLLEALAGDHGSLLSEDDARDGTVNALLEADAPDTESVVGLEPTGRKKEGGRPGGPLPSPINLDDVDRARDLHGIVVRTDDTPVAGAVLRSVYYPWRYGRLLTDGGHRAERLGPATRSASDGTFVLRLTHGDHVHLRATAEGLATTEFAMLQAGERIKVVLHEAVRLIVKALTPDGRPAAGMEVRIFGGARGAVTFERFGTTAEDGRFAFEDLPPGVAGYLDPRPLREGYPSPSNSMPSRANSRSSSIPL